MIESCQATLVCSYDVRVLFFSDFDDLGSAPSTPHYAIDGKTPISNLNFSELQRQIQDLNMQVLLMLLSTSIIFEFLFFSDSA